MSDKVEMGDRGRVVIGHWARRAVWARDEQGLSSAAIGLRRDRFLVIEWSEPEVVTAELWTGEPWEAPSAAVVTSNNQQWIARVPCCVCGDQGCADASYRFTMELAAADVPALADVLTSLPGIGVEAMERSSTVEVAGLAIPTVTPVKRRE